MSKANEPNKFNSMRFSVPKPTLFTFGGDFSNPIKKTNASV